MRNVKWILAFGFLCALMLLPASALADDPFGGPPSATSGDGATTWGAIYVADNCTGAIKFPAYSTRWFKVDTWHGYDLRIWLDDVPRDSAAKYFEGTGNDQAPNLVNGFWLWVYGTDALFPNYAYPDQRHRRDLLTTVNGIHPDGSEIAPVGMANHNKFIPEHLLWYESQMNGWVYFRVENHMPWDGNANICAVRAQRWDYAPPEENPDQVDPLDKYVPVPDR